MGSQSQTQLRDFHFYSFPGVQIKTGLTGLWPMSSQPEVCHDPGKVMGILDHLTCLLRNLYEGQEATIRTGHGTTDWFQTGKGVRQGCVLSPCLFNSYAQYIVRNAGLESRLLREISITSDMQMTSPLWQKVKN